jgi:protein TonB
MTDCPSDSAQVPEWRRSGYFLLIAVMLHGIVLALPLGVVGQFLPPAPPPILATLMPAPLPVSAPAPSPSLKPLQPPKPAPQKVAKPARPVMAVAAETSPAPATFSLPSPAPVPGAPVAPSTVPPTGPPAAVVSAARFNVAYLNNPEPRYPSLSRRLGEQGKVLLKVKVSAEGLAVAVDLEKSSNFERLDEAARQAVARWRFIPAKRGDEAIEASVIVPIVFRLDE